MLLEQCMVTHLPDGLPAETLLQLRGDAASNTYGQEGRGLYRKAGECVGRQVSV